jgi:hypothetical protein
MSYEHFPRATQEAVVFESRFGPVDGDIWLAPSQGNVGAAGCLRVEKEDRLKGTRSTAGVLDLRFHFAESVTEAVVEDTALAFKASLRTEEGSRFHRVSFLRHSSCVEGQARRWLGLVRRKSKKTAMEA